jgi:hypothetical protein
MDEVPLAQPAPRRSVASLAMGILGAIVLFTPIEETAAVWTIYKIIGLNNKKKRRRR